MNREDIIRMAREAGFYGRHPEAYNIVMIERFAALVAAAEREACAKLMESQWDWVSKNAAAAAIRARGNA